MFQRSSFRATWQEQVHSHLPTVGLSVYNSASKAIDPSDDFIQYCWVMTVGINYRDVLYAFLISKTLDSIRTRAKEIAQRQFIPPWC